MTADPPAPDPVLITGGAGRIGRMLRAGLARSGTVLRLLDTAPIPPAEPDEPVWPRPGSVLDPAALAPAMAGCRAVVHLAGIPFEAPWPELLASNVDGTRAVLEAARQAGTRTVVLASSGHAAGFHRRADAPPAGLPAAVPARPDTYYGFSKAAGEALGALYHERFGLDVYALRIGACFARPHTPRELAIWLSPGDAVRLVAACLRPREPDFRLLWGISANTRRWWSLAEGAAIGYHPQDDAERYATELAGAAGPERWLDTVGGEFTEVPLGQRS